MKQERIERAKRIGWVSLVVDVAIMSVAIRGIHREYARLHQGSLALLAHLLLPEFLDLLLAEYVRF